LSPSGEHGKILDFGLTKVTPSLSAAGAAEQLMLSLEEHPTCPEAAMGAVAYMSPEKFVRKN
jgi:serine/threonine protein kinase